MSDSPIHARIAFYPCRALPGSSSATDARAVDAIRGQNRRSRKDDRTTPKAFRVSTADPLIRAALPRSRVIGIRSIGSLQPLDQAPGSLLGLARAVHPSHDSTDHVAGGNPRRSRASASTCHPESGVAGRSKHVSPKHVSRRVSGCAYACRPHQAWALKPTSMRPMIRTHFAERHRRGLRESYVRVEAQPDGNDERSQRVP